MLLQNCYSDHKKTSNLEAYVEWFNRLSYLVATEICMVSDAETADRTNLAAHGGGVLKDGRRVFFFLLHKKAQSYNYC